MGALVDRISCEASSISVASGETIPHRYFFHDGLRFNDILRDPGWTVTTTYFHRMLNTSYNGSGLTFKVWWTLGYTLVAAGVAVWGIALAPGLGGFGTEYTDTSSGSGLALHFYSASIAVPHAAIPVIPRQFYRIRLRHLGTDPARTITVDPIFQHLIVTNTGT